MELKIGADPELFVRDKAGKNISGHDLIPGTKRQPYPVEGGAVQVDGTALEFNIAPALTEDEFVVGIQGVLERLRQMIPEGHDLHIASAVRYEEQYLDSLPPHAQELGCDPDFDAYTGTENEVDGEEAAAGLRTAAGHIHIGWQQRGEPFEIKHFQTCRTLSKELDCYLAIPSVFLDKGGAERRRLYGKAGAFRPKPYGCEYRVLSNFWLTDETLTRWVYRQTIHVFNHLLEGEPALFQTIPASELKRIINENDMDSAHHLAKVWSLEVPK